MRRCRMGTDGANQLHPTAERIRLTHDASSLNPQTTMSIPSARGLLSMLLSLATFVSIAARGADSLATLPPLGNGPYAVACTNLSQDFTRLLPGESAEDYWDGNPQGSRPRYVTNLLSDPANAFYISVPIPGDSEPYGRFAGGAIDVVSLICYPTSSNNPRPDYPLPTGTSIPHMQLG